MEIFSSCQQNCCSLFYLSFKGKKIVVILNLLWCLTYNVRKILMWWLLIFLWRPWISYDKDRSRKIEQFVGKFFRQCIVCWMKLFEFPDLFLLSFLIIFLFFIFRYVWSFKLNIIMVNIWYQSKKVNSLDVLKINWAFGVF
jgi:hypothetical protein